MDKEKDLFPTGTPVYMTLDWAGLPHDIRKLGEAFKNEKLRQLEGELSNTRQLSGNEFPDSVKSLDLETRQELVKSGVLQITGKKLYVVDSAVTHHVINHLHNQAHPTEEYHLATDATPEALKIILKAAEDEIFRHEKVKVEGSSDKIYNLSIVFQDGSRTRVYKTSVFPMSKYTKAPRMYMDYLRRPFTNTGLYYDVEKKQVIDHGHGLADIAKERINPIGGNLEKIVKKQPINALKYLNQLAGLSEAPKIGRRAKEILSSAKISDIAPKDSATMVQRGISHAVNKTAYIDLLSSTGLLRQLFPGIEVSSKVMNTNSKLPSLTIAQLFQHHFTNEEHLRSVLTHLGYDSRTVNDVVFLVKLPHYSNTRIASVPEFSPTHFTMDRLKTNLSDSALHEYITKMNFPNAAWLTKKLSEKNNARAPIDLGNHTKVG